MSRLLRAQNFARMVERSRQYQGMLDMAEDSILITDATLEAPGPLVRFANAAFERMTGYKRSELLGKSPRMLQGHNTDLGELRRMRESLALHQSFEGELINYRKGGREFIMGWAICAVHGPTGEINGWLAVQNDITADIRSARIRIPA